MGIWINTKLKGAKVHGRYEREPKAANSRVQKDRAAYGRVQKVKLQTQGCKRTELHMEVKSAKGQSCKFNCAKSTEIMDCANSNNGVLK